MAAVGIDQCEAGAGHNRRHIAADAAFAPFVVQLPFDLQEFDAEQGTVVAGLVGAQQGGRLQGFLGFQPFEIPEMAGAVAHLVKTGIAAQCVVDADHLHGLGNIRVDVDLFQNFLGREGAALHFDQGFGNVQVAYVDIGQHIRQQPIVAHLDKLFVALALFQRIEQTLVDLILIEGIDFLSRQQCALFDNSLAIGVVQAVGCLQRRGKLPGSPVHRYFHHRKIAVFRVFAGPDSGDLAHREIHHRKNQSLTDLITLVRLVNFAFGEFGLHAAGLAPLIFFDHAQGQLIGCQR